MLSLSPVSLAVRPRPFRKSPFLLLRDFIALSLSLDSFFFLTHTFDPITPHFPPLARWSRLTYPDDSGGSHRSLPPLCTRGSTNRPRQPLTRGVPSAPKLPIKAATFPLSGSFRTLKFSKFSLYKPPSPSTEPSLFDECSHYAVGRRQAALFWFVVLTRQDELDAGFAESPPTSNPLLLRPRLWSLAASCGTG
jgi:hypothetical protein